MTPALFVLYWIYQRRWRMVAWTAVVGIIFVVFIPAAALGVDRYHQLTDSWLHNVIFPGLTKASWYPVHINQSLPGVASRYLLGQPNPNGDIFYNPEDTLYEAVQTHQWIAPLNLSDWQAKQVVRVGQLVIVLLLAWGIGWSVPDRRDPRRALHYGLVALGMLILNQRTWDHHATILLITNAAIWYAIAFGQVGRRTRIAAVVLVLSAWAVLWASSGGLFALAGTDREGPACDGRAMGRCSRRLWPDIPALPPAAGGGSSTIRVAEARGTAILATANAAGAGIKAAENQAPLLRPGSAGWGCWSGAGAGLPGLGALG